MTGRDQTPTAKPVYDTRISTGVVGLDLILNGGLPQGHFFLLEGAPGTGKTTLALQFLLAGAKRGEKALYVTLSESRLELEGVARSHAWSLEDITLFEYVPNEESLRPEDQYSAFHPSEVEFQDTTQHILAEIERVSPSLIVFDSLSEIRLLARDSLRYRRQILALKHYFTNRNCTVLLLDDGTAAGHDLQLQSIAHGVILLERLAREYGKSRRRLHVVKMRGSTYREGYHDYSIQTGGITVFPRLVSSDLATEPEHGAASSGIPELDSIWGSGLDRGTSTLLLGPAGVGKSSIVLAYAVNAASQGERAALFLFEESARSAFRRAAGLGIDPAPHLASGMLLVEQINPAELSPGEFVEHVRSAVIEKDARVIVIDSLNGFLNAMPGEEHLPLMMHELLSFLNQRGVLTLLVLAQAGILGAAMTSPVDLSYLADNVMLFRYFEAMGKVRKAVSVVKKRTGSHEGAIRELILKPGRILVGEPLSDFRGVLTGIPTYLGAPEALDEKRNDRD